MPRFRFSRTSLVLSGLLFASSSTFATQTPDLARSLAAGLGAQGRLMWIDGTANIVRTIKTKDGTTVVDYTTTRAGVAEIVRHCKEAHINTLVIDVKPLSGQVLYNSKIAPHMTEWKGHKLPDFDVLAAFIEEGHKAGLAVDASVNLLSEGHKYYSVGLAYQNPDWQSQVYTVDRGLIAPDGSRLSAYVPGEPDDTNKSAILTDDSTILSGTPNSGLVGLETITTNSGSVLGEAHAPLGKQLNLVLDGDEKAVGAVDSALLGDDPLVAPEDGHIITAKAAKDQAWISQHVKPGDRLRFDMKATRTPITQAPSEKISCFVNPLHPEARKHELEMVRELVTNYAIDGLVLDRCRFSNLNNDFSDRSRDAFAQWLGKPIKHWPEDVFAFAPVPGEKPVYGPLFKYWLQFRAEVIRQLVGEVARCAREIKPKIVLGTYVGSWYPKYYEVGVNWGSEKTNLRYSWFTDEYPHTGYAEYFDWISTGCYYPMATREDARDAGLSEKGTVEYAADLSNLAVANGAFVYGGLYCVDYIGHPERFMHALEAAGRATQGWMIFDLSYIDEYNWWPLLNKAYSKPALSPDQLSTLLPVMRGATGGSQ